MSRTMATMSKLSLVAVLTAALAARAQAGTEPDEPPGPADAATTPAEPDDGTAPTADASPEDGAAPVADADDAEGAEGGKHQGKGKHKGKHDADAEGKPEADPDDDAAAATTAAAPDLEVSGRVFARFSAFDDDLDPFGEDPTDPHDVNKWTGGFSLASARVGVSYHWKKRLAAKVSFEVKGSVKDAYVDVKLADGLALRAGRFKLPVSAVERTSTWSLPNVDRTIVSDALGGSLGVVGRHSGVQLTWSGSHGLHPVVELSLAQAYDITGLESPRQLSDYAGVIATGRAELRPIKGVHVGAFVQDREVNFRTGIGRFWAGGVDLEADLPRAGLRVWGDAIAGSSHWGAIKVRDDHTPFVAAQLVAGWRHGGRKTGKRFVEPFVGAAYLNPIAQHKGDAVTQLQLGVGGGRWKRWRGQVQLAVQAAGDDRPSSLGGVDVDLNDQLNVTAQLGAGF